MQNIIRNLSEKLLSNETKSISLPDFKIQSLQKNKIAVSVTCHKPYLKYILEQVNAIDNQTHKAYEKFLFFDDCNIDEAIFTRNGWKVYSVNAHNPNILRNTAISLTTADWIVFADGDDVMDVNYLQSIHNTLNNKDLSHNFAAIYANLQHSTGHIYTTPDKHDKNSLKISNYVSACSAWNIKALREVGGYTYNSQCFDDWDLALRLSELGWDFKKNNNCCINVRDHNDAHRHLQEDKTIGFKLKRSYGIVTLLAGREHCFSQWKKWLLTADIPERTSLYIVDNSVNCKFRAKLNSAISCFYKSNRFKSITVIQDNAIPDKSQEYWVHVHVAQLYNKILPKISEDFVIFLEDDITPTKDGIFKLIEKYNIGNRVGAVSGVYESRTSCLNIGSAWGGKKDNSLDYWHNIIKRKEIEGQDQLDVNFIAGGFGLYNNGLVKKSLPLIFDYFQDKWPSGWDSDLSRKIRAQNKKLILACDVLCDHHMKTKTFMDVITYDKYKNIIKKINNKYWNESGEARWIYYEKVENIVREINPKSALEAGCFGMPVILDSETIDIDPEQKPTYVMDLGKTPFKFKNKQYDVFIALQVFEHLQGRQSEVFEEIKRISRNVILSFPYKWKQGDADHMNIDDEVISKWTNNNQPRSITKVNSRIIYFWSF